MTHLRVTFALLTKTLTTLQASTATMLTHPDRSLSKTWKTRRILGPPAPFSEERQYRTSSESMEILVCMPGIFPAIRLHTAAFVYRKAWQKNSSRTHLSARP